MDEFFESAYNEENQVDTQQEETIEEPTTEEPIQTEETIEEVATESTEEPSEAPQLFEVNGEKLTLEELQRGYMRQSDYTRKTQEIATQRKSLEQPVQQSFANPLEQRLAELEQKLADQELDNMITGMKSKYNDFDEVKVLNYAYEKGITDLDLAYKATREEKVVDVESMRNEMAKQIRAEIMQELESNKTATSTVISNGNVAVQNNSPQLSQREMLMAEEFGLTADEYLQYK